MKIYTVDTFTNRPFTGNPAAVCVLDQKIEEGLMLKIAREINFSETAFVVPKETPTHFSLRWFTPTQEVDLCGHATLATAKILYENKIIQQKELIKFYTKSGLLTSQLVDNKIVLDFPSKYINPSKSDDILNKFTHANPTFVGIYESWCLIELEDTIAVQSIIPDFELLKTHPQQIFIVTAKSENKEYDFVSRCFGPAIGINEDPVTGSAHCYLATYWSNKLKKDKLIGFQTSERTGVIECELIENHRVLLTGECIIMSEIKQNWT